MTNVKKQIMAVVISAIFCIISAISMNYVSATEVDELLLDDESNITVYTGENYDPNKYIINNITGSKDTPYTGGWGQSWVSRIIYNDSDLTSPITGISLPAGVGFTILDQTSTAYCIDTYISSTQHVLGCWISRTPNMSSNFTAITGVATSAGYAYGGTNSSTFEYIGSFGTGSNVTVLSKSGTYYYVEFNNSSYLRKRGWVPSSCLSLYGSATPIDFDTLSGNMTYYGNNQNVHYAPGTGYISFTSIGTDTRFSIVNFTTIHGIDYALINYIPYAGAKVRTGYIVF